MEKAEFEAEIQKYSVRIGKYNSEKTLKGSGVLFPVEVGSQICVLTVAHIAEALKRELENKGEAICIDCKDAEGIVREIVINDPQKIYIHSQYKENMQSGEKNLSYDVAAIMIPWQTWMDDLKGYLIAIDDFTGKEIEGYGFPNSLDKERKRDYADFASGISHIEGRIESQDNRRLAIEYTANTESEIPRDSILHGYSGTGLFTKKQEGIYLCGLLSCSRGERTAGYKLWALKANEAILLLEKNNIQIGYPKTFQIYKDIVQKEFDSFRKKCIRQWKENAEEIINKKIIVPQLYKNQVESKFPCFGNRKICSYFWKEKLKELVIMHNVQGIPIEELQQSIVQMPSPYNEDKVVLEFLCTEFKAQNILGSMIENREFSKGGRYHNNTIILVNSMQNHSNREIMYSRKDCRNIMSNIADGYEECTKTEIDDVWRNLVEQEENITFDIVKGSVEKCNIAAIGTSRMMDILNQDSEEKMKQKMNGILIELWGE